MNTNSPTRTVQFSDRPDELADWAAGHVFRHDASKSGFACLRLPGLEDSRALRKLMSELRFHLSEIYLKAYGQSLEYYSLGRFDQKKTTKLHLDGGPSSSFLMLGYEPSDVFSRFLMGDFSRCALDHGLSPEEFLQQKNPMFSEEGRQLLAPYIRPLEEWNDGESRIVIVNNGSLPPGSVLPGVGVMHGAEILFTPDSPDSASSRVINSTMFVPESETPKDTREALQSFLETQAISGQIL